MRKTMTLAWIHKTLIYRYLVTGAATYEALSRGTCSELSACQDELQCIVCNNGEKLYNIFLHISRDDVDYVYQLVYIFV